jgi:hypothetical protein
MMDERCTLYPRHRRLRAMAPVLLGGLVLLLVLAGTAAAAPTNLPQQVVPDPVVATIISRITTPTLEYELAGLTGERPVTVAGSLTTIATRHSYQTEAISIATCYAYEQLNGLGLDVTYHNYTFGSYSLRNVVAEKPGLVDPDEIYLITAHVDDLPAGPVAPGADDNGSGSVAVLMAARLLAPYHFAHTVRFVLFTGEEEGLRGSDAYAAECAARGEDIQGVVNLDMIGYDETGEPVYNAYARSGTYTGAPESRQLADLFSDVAEAYELNLVDYRIDIDSYPLKWGSDQWSFLSRGYPAILVIEDDAGGDFNPYYHTTSDQLAFIDLEYFSDMTRAAVATIAHLGQRLPRGHLAGTIYAQDTGHPIHATVDAFSPTYGYTFTAPTDGSGVYSLSLPSSGAPFTVQATAPTYYPATATDVFIAVDTVTVQDIGLEPWQRTYLPRILHEPH